MPLAQKLLAPAYRAHLHVSLARALPKTFRKGKEVFCISDAEELDLFFAAIIVVGDEEADRKIRFCVSIAAYYCLPFSRLWQRPLCLANLGELDYVFRELLLFRFAKKQQWDKDGCIKSLIFGLLPI